MEGNRWVARPKYGLPPPVVGAVRLFCFTPAGAGPTVYSSNSWTKLPPSIELAPVLLPGRAQRFTEEALRTVEEIAAQALDGLRPALAERPYALYGHSLGSCVALEFARLVAASADLPQPVHVFLAAKGAPLTPSSNPMASIPGDMDFVRAVQAKYESQAMQMVIDNPDLMEMVLPMMRADFGAAESYVVGTAEPLSVPVSAIGGSKDVYTEQHFTAWAQFVKPDCWRGVTMLEGATHMSFVTDPPPELCDLLVKPMQMPTACSLSTRLWLQAWIVSWLVNWRWVASATAIAAAERHGDDNADGLHPKLSAHLNDGFVLWDVVALFVLARPELFSDWSRHEVRLFNESELARNAALFAKQQSQVRRQQLTKTQQRQRGAAKYADAEEGPEVGDDAGTDTTLGLRGELEVSAEIGFAGEVDYGNSFWRTEHERTQERGRVTVPRTLSSEAALLAEFHGHLCTPQAAAAVAALPPSLLSWWVVLGVLPHLVFLAAAGFGGAYWLLIQDGGGKFGALFGVGNGNHAGDLADFRDRDRDRERAASMAQWEEPAVGRKARPPEREGFEEQDDKEEGKGASEAEEKRQATPVASSANSLVAGLDLVEQVAVEEEQMAVDAAAITTATTEAETEEDEEEETEEDLLQRRRLWSAGRERRVQRAISEMVALTHTASTNKAELSRVLRKYAGQPGDARSAWLALQAHFRHLEQWRGPDNVAATREEEDISILVPGDNSGDNALSSTTTKILNPAARQEE